MHWVYQLIGFAIGLALVIAAFWYLWNPRETQQAAKALLVPGLALTVVAALMVQFANSHPVGAFLAFLAVSAAAYGIRQRRLGRRPPQRRLGRAERTPILPRREGRP